MAQPSRETKLSDIFSAPLELAKNKIDAAISDDATEDDPAGQLHVASTPCLAGASDADCTKHWAAHYMSRATEASILMLQNGGSMRMVTLTQTRAERISCKRSKGSEGATCLHVTRFTNLVHCCMSTKVTN